LLDPVFVRDVRIEYRRVVRASNVAQAKLDSAKRVSNIVLPKLLCIRLFDHTIQRIVSMPSITEETANDYSALFIVTGAER